MGWMIAAGARFSIDRRLAARLAWPWVKQWV
jgi:hypothetical protein